MKTTKFTLAAALLVLPLTHAQEHVDKALKGRDLSTIMKMLKTDGQKTPEPVVKAAPAPQTASTLQSIPTPKAVPTPRAIEPTKSAPAANTSKLQEYSDGDLQSIRAKLAAELRAAREEAQKASLDLETKAAAVAIDANAKPSADLLKDLGNAAPVATPEVETTVQATPQQMIQATPGKSAVANAMTKTAAAPIEMAATTERKRGSLFNRVFGNRDAKKTAQPSPQPTQVAVAPVRPTPVSAPPKTKAPAPIKAAPIQVAQANPSPIKVTPPKAPSVRPAPAGTAPRPAIQPAPAIRVSQPAPAIRNVGGGDGVRNNRNALDSLVQQSRADIVKMAMNQASGNAAAAAAPVDPDAWKKAGPNAWKYDGEWKDGSMHGQGRMQFVDGWEYAGAFVGGTMHGQGTLTYPDGTVYEGQFRNGKMDGFGKLTYPDGWSFIGNWSGGQISGSGTLVNPGN